MKEQEAQQFQPNSYHDFALGETIIDNESTHLYLAVSTYPSEVLRRPPIPILELNEPRLDVDGYFYTLRKKPDLISPEARFRRVLTLDEPQGEDVIGSLDASYYINEQILLIWGCSRAMCGYIYDEEFPENIQELYSLWAGCEGVLAEILPEPLQTFASIEMGMGDEEFWMSFLHSQGYRSYTEKAMIKQTAPEIPLRRLLY